MLVYRRYSTNGAVTESVHENCEHCEEKVRDVHVSEVITKVKRDARTIVIKDANNQDYTIKEKAVRRLEIKELAISKSLLDDYNEALKYENRAEAFCSQSFDPDSKVTSSYCYRVTHPKVVAKFGSLFSDAGAWNSTGSKKGIRRQKAGEAADYVHLVQRLKVDQNADGDDIYEYPWNVNWVKNLIRVPEGYTLDILTDEILTRESDCPDIAGTAGEYLDYNDWRNRIAVIC